MNRIPLERKALGSVFVTGLAIGAVVTFSLGMTGCQTNEKPVDFTLLVPEPNTLQFDVELNKRYGLQLSGELDILQYGTIYLRPESPESFFGFGFMLHTDVFLKESWVNYREVTALPTGTLFPNWMGPVVDVVIPELNTQPVDWHFYFGTRGQLYLGVAAIIRAIDQNFPAVNIGYTFYDKQGRVVLGLLFFGPSVGSNGQLLSPGGIFLGTNITPYLPDWMQTLPGEGGGGGASTFITSAQLEASGVDVAGLVSAAHEGREVSIAGTSAIADIQVTGRDRRRYNNRDRIEGLVRRFGSASQR